MCPGQDIENRLGQEIEPAKINSLVEMFYAQRFFIAIKNFKNFVSEPRISKPFRRLAEDLSDSKFLFFWISIFAQVIT